MKVGIHDLELNTGSGGKYEEERDIDKILHQ